MGRVTRFPIKAPFRDGIVDDFFPWEIPITASPGPFEDFILHRGIAQSRGGWNVIGVLNVFSQADAYRSVASGTFPGDPTLKLIVVDAAGRLGTVDGAGATFPNAGALLNFLPRCWYNGELVLCAQDGKSSGRIFAGREVGAVASTSLWNFTKDSKQITRATGADDLNVYSPAYTFVAGGATVSGGPSSQPVYRMERVQSATEGTLSSPYKGITGQYYLKSASAGVFGQLSVVQSLGTINSIPNTSTGTIGLSSSALLSGARGHGVVTNGDYVGTLEVLDATGQSFIALITSVDSEIQLKYLGRGFPSAASGRVNYQIGRNLVGKEACVYRNRLFMADLDWAPRRLQWIGQAGDDSSSYYNGFDSPLKEEIAARMAGFTEVPNENIPGNLEALMPTEGPLLLACSDGLYRFDGEPLGTGGFTVSILHSGAGCVDKRSAIVTEDGAYWVGSEGVHSYINGGYADLTRGRRNDRWRRIVKDKSATANFIGFAHDDHYVVGYNDGAASETWVCHLPTRAWTTFSAFKPRGVWVSKLPGKPDEVYFINEGARQVATAASMFRDDDISAETPNLGTPRAALPWAAIIRELGQEVRFVELRPDIQLFNKVAPNPTLLVKSGPTFGPLSTNKTIVGGTLGQTTWADVKNNYANWAAVKASNPTWGDLQATFPFARQRRVHRIKPLSKALAVNGALGLLERDAQVQLELGVTGTYPRVRIHGLELVVRERRLKVAS